MRILLTTDTVGGVWTFTRELTEQFLQAGHAVALVSFGRLPSPDQSDWVVRVGSEYAEQFLYRASEAPLEWMQTNQRSYEDGAVVLRALADLFAPDLLHTNQFCFGMLPISVPRVLTAHSDVRTWADACRPAGLDDSEWLRKYDRLVRQGLESADAVVAPTRWMGDALLRHYHIPGPIQVIHNGRSLPNATEMTPRNLQAVSVGRLWDEAKGMATLMEINARMPIFIAGEEKFQADAAAGPASGVQCVGHLSQDAVLDLFRASSVYVASSIYEPFGLAPLEAALCGCAVVARDLPSLREVWNTGAIYFTNADELAWVLNGLACNPDALRYARALSESRARLFSAEHMAAKYISAYERCLEAKLAPSGTTEDLAANAA